MFKEFKEFAMKGNLVDMAVAFVMGGAFATLVTAFIQGVFLPLLSPIMGGLDFGSWNYEMVPATLGADGEVLKEAVVVKIGDFISAIISDIDLRHPALRRRAVCVWVRDGPGLPFRGGNTVLPTLHFLKP